METMREQVTWRRTTAVSDSDSFREVSRMSAGSDGECDGSVAGSSRA